MCVKFIFFYKKQSFFRKTVELSSTTITKELPLTKSIEKKDSNKLPICKYGKYGFIIIIIIL